MPLPAVNPQLISGDHTLTSQIGLEDMNKMENMFSSQNTCPTEDTQGNIRKRGGRKKNLPSVNNITNTSNSTIESDIQVKNIQNLDPYKTVYIPSEATMQKYYQDDNDFEELNEEDIPTNSVLQSINAIKPLHLIIVIIILVVGILGTLSYLTYEKHKCDLADAIAATNTDWFLRHANAKCSSAYANMMPVPQIQSADMINADPPDVNINQTDSITQPQGPSMATVETPEKIAGEINGAIFDRAIISNNRNKKS